MPRLCEIANSCTPATHIVLEEAGADRSVERPAVKKAIAEKTA